MAVGAPVGCTTLGVSACVCPAPRLAALGITLTLVMAAGSGATVMVAEPVIPSTVAVMVAVPAATAETVPVAETVATAGVLLLHVTARPVSEAPAASRAVATSTCTPPITREAVAGVTTTEATEEAVIDAMLMAETMTGRDGNTAVALPAGELMELMRKYQRI